METDEDLRRRAIDTTVSQFDFDKVQKAAEIFSMRWDPLRSPRAPLSVEQIKDIAREILGKAWDDELAPNCEYCHGGLRATRTDGVLSLQFVLEESFFVAALDAEAA